MMVRDAQRVLADFLWPLTLDEFLDRTLSGGFRKISDGGAGDRTRLLGESPEAALLDAVHLAPSLTFHSANPSGPPPSLEGVADPAEFRRRIGQFHGRNYSVRFPDLRPLSPALDALARALEILLHQPVTASAFWSRGGMRSPVHYDDHDLLVIQLRGAKRWYISTRPSPLPNAWKGAASEAPELGPHEIVDVRPGDVLYLPRGAFHSVDSDVESLHLAIGFTPLTLRDAVIAALDHLSDLDRPLRATVGERLALQLNPAGVQQLGGPVEAAAARLLEACRAPGFLLASLQRRSSRTIGRLQPLPKPGAAAAIALDTVLRQAGPAFCHLTATEEQIDFSYPGGHLYIHRGAQAAVVYMVNTGSFRVRDIPGGIGDDVRLFLAASFVEIGFLEVDAAARAPRAAEAARSSAAG